MVNIFSRSNFILIDAEAQIKSHPCFRYLSSKINIATKTMHILPLNTIKKFGMETLVALYI